MKLNSIMLATSALVFVASVSNAQSGADWAGFYAGAEGSFVNGQFSQNGGPQRELENSESVSGGIFAGYNFAMNGLLIGAEVAWSSANYSDASYPENYFTGLADAKLIVGYPIEGWLPYAVVGGTTAGFHLTGPGSGGVGNLGGTAYGVGVSRKITDHLFVGAELLQRNLSGTLVYEGNTKESSVDSKFRTLSVRVGYEF